MGRMINGRQRWLEKKANEKEQQLCASFSFWAPSMHTYEQLVNRRQYKADSNAFLWTHTDTTGYATDDGATENARHENAGPICMGGKCGKS